MKETFRKFLLLRILKSRWWLEILIKAINRSTKMRWVKWVASFLEELILYHNHNKPIPIEIEHLLPRFWTRKWWTPFHNKVTATLNLEDHTMVVHIMAVIVIWAGALIRSITPQFSWTTKDSQILIMKHHMPKHSWTRNSRICQYIQRFKRIMLKYYRGIKETQLIEDNNSPCLIRNRFLRIQLNHSRQSRSWGLTTLISYPSRQNNSSFIHRNVSR